MFEKLESWKDSFKNRSQWINLAVALAGGSLFGLTEAQILEVTNAVFAVFGALGVINIAVRNWKQPNKNPQA